MHSLPVYAGKREKTDAKERGESLRRRLMRIRPSARETGRFLAEGVCFFLLSLSKCLSVPSPYAVCMLSVLLHTGFRPYGALAGLLGALVFRMLWGIETDLAQYAACFLCFFLLVMPKMKKGRFLVFTLVLLVVRAAPGILHAPDIQSLILQSFSLLIGLGSIPALRRGAELIKEKRLEWNEDDALCMLLPLLLLICGASGISLFQVNLGFLLSDGLVLFLGWGAGAGAGVCLGLGCALALMLGGRGASMLIVLSFGGLFAGMMTGKKRFITALLYLTGEMAICYIAFFSFQMALFLPACCGTVIFLSVPSKQVKKLLRLLRKVRWKQPEESLCSRIRMQRWAYAIQNMASALPSTRIQPVGLGEESEEIAEKLCDQCERLPICWRDQYEETKHGMENLAQRTEEEGGDYLPVINRYFSACPRIAEIPDILYALDEKRQERLSRSVCADYEMEMLRTHLQALSQAALKMSGEGTLISEEESYWKTQVEEALQALRFPGHTVFAKRVDGKMMICLQYEPLSLRMDLNSSFVRHVGISLGISLVMTEQKAGRVILEEEPPLCVITGMATACAVTMDRKLKMGSRIDNGDAVIAQNLPGGKMLLALSDGMGHGSGAQDESRKTLELLALCMEVGYSRAQAMTAVNGAMLSATAGEKFATVDLCTVDLWNGEAAMNKLGACVSVLIRGQKIRILSGEALPLGIIERVTPTEHGFTLAEGDMLLMMSDGITDAFPSDEDLLSVIRRLRDETPQHVADALLQEAIIQQDGLPKDDMTVLCAQITERKTQKARWKALRAS